MKELPCGISNFETIIREDYYYIDKSLYIDVLEHQNAFILLNRPRRMGKSLFSSMMMSYYDIAKKKDFGTLFGNLWIGNNPTKRANTFVVLSFDFSQVSYSYERLEKNFTKYCLNVISRHLKKYDDIYTEEDRRMILDNINVKDAVNVLVDLTHLKGLPIYLFIDEYDNFSNTVFTSHGVEAHRQITHGEGFFRDFFKCCKGTFERVFMTGITPVTYDDLYSGFSIADVVSLLPKFNHIIGISEDELTGMIEYYRAAGKIQRSTETIIAEMKPWYNNFCFADECYGTEPPVYNTDMVLTYMRKILTDDKTPKEMIVYSARTDTNKLDYLVTANDLSARSRREEIIADICSKGYTTGEVLQQLPAETIGSEENFKSMLFYMGTLTFGGYGDDGLPKLIVTNRTMGDLYLKYMAEIIGKYDSEFQPKVKALNELVRKAAVDGEWCGMIEELARMYADNSSLRDAKGGEYDIHGYLRGVLSLNSYFAVWPELELARGYSDILLVPRANPQCPTRHSYVLEVKRMRASDTDVDAKVAEACSQLDRYEADTRLHASPLLRGSSLTKLYAVFRSLELVAAGEHPCSHR